MSLRLFFMQNVGVHWFRRDLRIENNRALAWNLREMQGQCLCVFFFDPKFLSRADFSPNRFAFFLETLNSLRTGLRGRGGDLLVLAEGPDSGFERIFALLNRRGLRLRTVSWNRDYEPFARERDERIERFLRSKDVHVHTERDHLIFEPGEILKDDGSPYRVFTPYFRRWSQKLLSESERLQFGSRPRLGAFKIDWSSARKLDRFEKFRNKNASKVTVKVPQAGYAQGLFRLQSFKARLTNYMRDRDFPALNGTSKMSIFLKNGSATSAQMLSRLKLQRMPKHKFVSEVAWREFYYSILYHFPHVETAAFNSKYESIKWENNVRLFEAWKRGETGFPLVDAAMRELAQTGNLHNRLRMIVASFLVKDLHVDWRWGERYFMQQLLDGDIAANNGGWQWAASTGCDAQPYFRVFNPELQQKKFDPEFKYISRWLPEFKKGSYIKPIVNHSQRARRAIAMYRADQ